jgi:hypothetical protein
MTSSKAEADAEPEHHRECLHLRCTCLTAAGLVDAVKESDSARMHALRDSIIPVRDRLRILADAERGALFELFGHAEHAQRVLMMSYHQEPVASAPASFTGWLDNLSSVATAGKRIANRYQNDMYEILRKSMPEFEILLARVKEMRAK